MAHCIVEFPLDDDSPFYDIGTILIATQYIVHFRKLTVQFTKGKEYQIIDIERGDKGEPLFVLITNQGERVSKPTKFIHNNFKEKTKWRLITQQKS